MIQYGVPLSSAPYPTARTAWFTFFHHMISSELTSFIHVNVRAHEYVYVCAYVHHMCCVSVSALHALCGCVCACAWAVDVTMPMHLHVCMYMCHSSQQERHDSHSAIIDINRTCSLYTYVYAYACYNDPFYTNVSGCRIAYKYGFVSDHAIAHSHGHNMHMHTP